MRIFMMFASRSRSKAAGAPSMLAISEVRSATYLRSQVGDLERSISQQGDYLGELVGVGEAAQHA